MFVLTSDEMQGWRIHASSNSERVPVFVTILIFEKDTEGKKNDMFFFGHV